MLSNPARGFLTRRDSQRTRVAHSKHAGSDTMACSAGYRYKPPNITCCVQCNIGSHQYPRCVHIARCGGAAQRNRSAFARQDHIAVAGQAVQSTRSMATHSTCRYLHCTRGRTCHTPRAQVPNKYPLAPVRHASVMHTITIHSTLPSQFLHSNAHANPRTLYSAGAKVTHGTCLHLHFRHR